MERQVFTGRQPDSVLEADPVIEAYKKDVDRTLIRENLRLTVEERLDKLERLQRFADELRRAGRNAGHQAAQQRSVVQEALR